MAGEIPTKKLPIGLQSFRKIRESDYLYADKTKYIYNLIQSEGSIFLSRPRRFGKSLLVSALEELFLGNRDLFKGLWIDSCGYEFLYYPVIHLDMSVFSAKSVSAFEKDLLLELKRLSKSEGIQWADASPGAVFRNLILDMSRKYNKRIVILIDEYDRPILENLHTAFATDMRDTLREIYSVLKGLDGSLRFVFVTGVSKFSKTSVFSGANQFIDITLHPNFANICGIEITEFEALFTNYLNHDAAARREQIQQISQWYDGYSWDGESFLYNPFSLLSYFDRRQFKAYWFATGTPAFLFNLIKNNPLRYASEDPYEIIENDLDAMDISSLPIIPLLFQTGYLTIANKPDNSGVYELRIPNREVNEAFHKHLLIALSGLPEEDMPMINRGIIRALQEGKPEKLQLLLVSLFSSIPYQLHIEAESYYHSIFFVLLKLIGVEISAEISIGRGRVDVVLKTVGYIYIMEWKYCKCNINEPYEIKQKLLSDAVQDAHNQIISKGYSKPYLADGRTIIEVSVAVTARADVLVQVNNYPLCPL